MARIVLADDDASFREALVALLVADGRFDVVGEASDGSEALDLVVRTRPDLVILDVRMPGGGAEAVRSILAASGPHFEVTLAVLSADVDPRQMLAILRNGAGGYLLKGVVGNDLPDLLLRIARGEVVIAVPGAQGMLQHALSPRSDE